MRWSAGLLGALWMACGGEAAPPPPLTTAAPSAQAPAPQEPAPPEPDVHGDDVHEPAEPDAIIAAPEVAPTPAPEPVGVSAVMRDIAPWLTGDLAGGHIHEVAAGIAIDVTGPGPKTLEALFARARELGLALAEHTKDPNIGLVVRWSENQRLVAWLHHTDVGWRARGGAYGLVVADRADYRLAANPEVSYSMDFSEGDPYELTCGGEVENLTEAPLDVVVACHFIKTDKDYKKASTPIIKTRTLAKLGPGKTRRFTMKLGRSNAGYDVQLKLEVGGEPVAYFNKYAWDEAVDFIGTADAVIADTGLSMRSVALTSDPLKLHVDHKGPEFDAAEFARLSKARQREIGSRVAQAFNRHYGRFHDKARPPYIVHEGQWRWYLGANGATPID